jgi:enoyl-CoA hydratase/carnithine racemase
MLRIECSDGVAVWTIARPATKNALDFATLEALRDALVKASYDPNLRAIVLTGEGHTFVSGGDLRELRSVTTPEETARFVDAGRAVTQGIAIVPVPVIAALSGAAIGGGAELALACDLRIADMRAKIAFKQVRLGVTPAWGTTARLVSLIGHGLAARLLYTGHELTAAEAYAFGLVDAVVENGSSVATAMAWAMDIAAGSPTAIAETKALLRSLAHKRRDIDEEERARFVRTWLGPDHVEAVAAFFERRPPVWRPRHG